MMVSIWTWKIISWDYCSLLVNWSVIAITVHFSMIMKYIHMFIRLTQKKCTCIAVFYYLDILNLTLCINVFYLTISCSWLVVRGLQHLVLASGHWSE